MAKKGIRAGNSYKVQYKAYKASNRFAKNKQRKLEKHCLAHPNDEAAEKVLDTGGFTYSRNKRSQGHQCKPKVLHSVKNPQVKPPVSAGEQMVALGLVNEKKYTKSIRYRKSRVLPRKSNSNRPRV